MNDSEKVQIRATCINEAINGHKYKDFASKLRTLQNRIDWINEFLKPLNLNIKIVEHE